MATPNTGGTLNGGVYLGTVTRVDAAGAPYVEVPRLLPGFEFGPLTSSAGTLTAGDGIVVGFLEGHPDTPVVVARLGGPAGIGGTTAGPATDTTAGLVELATATETSTGTDATRAVTPAGLAPALGAKANSADLGTAATRNVPGAGNAAAAEVVLGADTRLTDARTPTAHHHPTSDVDGLGTAATRNVPAAGNAAAAEVVLGNDARLADARTPTGAAGGDLSGTYPNPTVAAALKDPAAATAGLRSLGTGAQQAAAGNDARLSNARTPTGAAGGGLGDTYPNPTVRRAYVPDTRATDDTPQHDTRAVKWQFKSSSTVGITDGSTYCVVEYLRGYSDTSAGLPFELAYTDAGNVYKRTATAIATNTWGAWVKVADASQPVVFGNDARLSDARTPTAHAASHASGGSDPVTPAAIGAAPTAHQHAAADVSSGTLAIARLPVAASGTSSTTAVVRADDARLSDARTPTAHTHATGDVTGLDTALAGKQPLDATLTGLAGVATAADQLVYATGVDTFAATALTAGGRQAIATTATPGTWDWVEGK